MGIKAPNWAPNAIPTRVGWVNEKGELLKSQKITGAQINEFYGENEDAKPTPLNEAPANNSSVDEMSSVELQNIGSYENANDAEVLVEENDEEPTQEDDE